MVDEVHTYSHPDVTPAQVLLKRHYSLSSPLGRLSNGQLFSTSFTNNDIIDANDPRIMPPPRKAVIRRNILMGRPSAIHAATSAVRSRSLWNNTTKTTPQQGPIPCPPTPPDSLASSSESDTTTTRELSPKEQKQHKHKHKQESTLAWHPLPTLVGIEQHSNNQNKANNVTATTVSPLKGTIQSFSIPPPPLRTHVILPWSASETIGGQCFNIG
ncbi:hypothetical protein BDC45DRAFT_531106 [Circinella umbellata]|nr:hypothetical protein BDC45DRAFT_531106 [Circinella umbellata]